METCSWPLGNGEGIKFTIFSHKANWNYAAGLYIFAYRTDTIHWRAIYVGQTNDFSSRIPNHKRWNEAVRLGATHVHAAVIPLPE